MERNNSEPVVLLRVPEKLLDAVVNKKMSVRDCVLFTTAVIEARRKFEGRVRECELPGCMVSFTPRNFFSTRRYCSDRCRNMARRQEKDVARRALYKQSLELARAAITEDVHVKRNES